MTSRRVIHAPPQVIGSRITRRVSAPHSLQDMLWARAAPGTQAAFMTGVRMSRTRKALGQDMAIGHIDLDAPHACRELLSCAIGVRQRTRRAFARFGRG